MKIDYTLWPNPDGQLGKNKIKIPDGITVEWPDGDALVGKFVYKDGKLVGFVDNKALTVNDSKSTTFPYDYVNIQVDKSLEGVMSFNKGERTKYLTISYTMSGNGGDETFDFVIIDFNTTDAETINTVRTAKRVVDKTMYAEDGSVIGTWDTSKIEVGGFYDEERDKGDGLFFNFVNGAERGIILSDFNSDLNSLEDGSTMFAYCANLESFTSDMPSLTNGSGMFCMCSTLTSFTSDLPSLTNGYSMFMFCDKLESITSDMPSLTNGSEMFFYCENLTTFTSDLSNLTNGHCMFAYCANLESFTSDLSSLTNGYGMLGMCGLTSFFSDLSSLTKGYLMFLDSKLDTASVQNIADTIKNVSSLTDGLTPDDEVFKTIHIGIGNSTPNDQETTAFNTIASKGWTVYVNGSQYTPSSVSSIMTLDELGNEVETPIPYYAKPVPATEETASYVDANGNFFNILGGQFIYGDDLSTYGMFTCEEDAAANMRLTKYERPEETEKTNPLLKLKNVLKPNLTQEEKKAKLMELFGRNKS